MGWFCAEEDVPSPKFQLYVTAPGALGVEVLVKETATPGQTEVSFAKNETVGALYTVMVTDFELEPSALVAVKVTV